MPPRAKTLFVTPLLAAALTIAGTAVSAQAAAPTADQSTHSTLTETFPTPSTTGVPAGTTLTTLPPDGYSGGVPYYVMGAGETITAKKFTGKIIVSGNNAKIVNSEIWGTIDNGLDNHYSFSVTDSTLGAPDGHGCDGNVAIQYDQYTALRVRVRNFADAFRSTNLSGASNISIKDSFAKLCSNPDDHSDGFQGYYGGGNVLVQHNTIDQRGLAFGTVTAPIFNSDDSDGITLKNNLLMGGSFTIRLDGNGTQSVAQDNRVVNNSWFNGPASSSGPDDGSNCPWITWTGNTLVTINSSYAITGTVGSLACV